MAINRTTPGVAYGLSDALLDVFSPPVVSTRDPLTTDKAQLGTLWVNKGTNNFFVLTSIVANVATWSSVSNGAGIFTSLEATTGNITADLGDIVATVGNVSAGNDVVAQVNVTATTGNIAALAGSITADVNLTATTGDITANVGDVDVLLGDIVVSVGDITTTAGDIHSGDAINAVNDITSSSGDIIATAGAVVGAQFEATGDLGGVALSTTLTNVTNTALSTGTLVIKSTTANPGNNAGFLKMYVGATAVFVPYYTNIAP